MDLNLGQAGRSRCAGAPGGTSELEGRRVHLIGVGGCGMMGLASILSQMGARVSGSDARSFAEASRLRSEGVAVSIGHSARHVGEDVVFVVRSAAIPKDNVEFVEARRRGVTVAKYAEFLGALMKLRVGVAVAGTHGKSTTTAMCAHVFRSAGLEPSYLVGACSSQLGGNAAWGSGAHLIVESCEYDRSFLNFRPALAAILNVEQDHPDCYADPEALVEAFACFAGQVDSDGLIVCPEVGAPAGVWALRAAERSRARVETFGLGAGADWRAVRCRRVGGAHAFNVCYRGRHVFSTRLKVLGLHNVHNALAAAALADAAGVPPVQIGAALSTFEGVSRRLSLRGAGRGVTVVDDYAHHPTEIRVTIEAAQHGYEPKRTVVVFQPHQYCRTQSLLDEFAESFYAADEVIVPDVYDVRETGTGDDRVGSAELVARLCDRGVRGRHVPRLPEVADWVFRHMVEGDLVLTLGAGDVWKVADDFVERIC